MMSVTYQSNTIMEKRSSTHSRLCRQQWAATAAAELIWHTINESDEQNYSNDTEPYDTFNDFYFSSDNTSCRSCDILLFLTHAMESMQMEFECLYPALIYMKRLSVKTNGQLRLCSANWRSLVATALMLSSKVWDDVSMINSDFVNIYPTTRNLSQVNMLEKIALLTLSYDVNVQHWEYDSYAVNFQPPFPLPHIVEGEDICEIASCGGLMSLDANKVSCRSLASTEGVISYRRSNSTGSRDDTSSLTCSASPGATASPDLGMTSHPCHYKPSPSPIVTSLHTKQTKYPSGKENRKCQRTFPMMNSSVVSAVVYAVRRGVNMCRLRRSVRVHSTTAHTSDNKTAPVDMSKQRKVTRKPSCSRVKAGGGCRKIHVLCN